MVANIICSIKLTLKLTGVRSKFKTIFFFFFKTVEFFADVFSCNPLTLYQRKMYKFRIPRKNQHWVYFYHSNLKVGQFGPPPVALGLNATWV